MYSDKDKIQRYKWIDANKEYLREYRALRKTEVALYYKEWYLKNKEKKKQYEKDNYIYVKPIQKKHKLIKEDTKVYATNANERIICKFGF